MSHNIFLDLPMPAGNGAGASVDTSAMGGNKSIIIGGNLDGAAVDVEISNDGSTFFPVLTFFAADKVTIPAAGQAMRVNVRNRGPAFSANVDVGDNNNGTLSASLPLPAGTGAGTPVNLAAFGSFSTFIAVGSFEGATISVEVSEDGVDYFPCGASFSDYGGVRNREVTANWARTFVRGNNAVASVSVGSSNNAASTQANDVIAHWMSQTEDNIQHSGGFYEFSGADDDFSPSITFGVVNAAKAGHLSIVTGAVAVGEVQITVTGASINDAGARTPADDQIITIPDGTPANSYFETPKKWLGRVTLETTSGTPITCNYFRSKYFDAGNKDFLIKGLEALWESDSSDSTSNIELLHHKATGWTFNAAANPTTPPAIAARNTDYAPDIKQDGEGAWKRTDLAAEIFGADAEGILWRITSGSTGLGSLSFRVLNLELTINILPT